MWSCGRQVVRDAANRSDTTTDSRGLASGARIQYAQDVPGAGLWLPCFDTNRIPRGCLPSKRVTVFLGQLAITVEPP